MEFGIHGWMHLHWSSLPPPEAQNTLVPSNDRLGSPFSSHVNNHFWKLHGWIDDRIIVWEDALGTEANLSQGREYWGFDDLAKGYWASSSV
ncbi:hypothetical protein [Paenibacillus sp. Mc5Re-14]|uniref:hypothetical protein n=1 Tax=Paenibacillus sp. Mc5Re-14 TaxID=1030529 RepID=UPI00159EE4F8|nr:hypothetical protein [Paenibacillus sp. Mc5Re-14]